MFIRVKIDGENVILVNHNCGVRMIAEFLKVKTDLPDNYEIDLCHQCGYLTKLHTLDPTLNGIKLLKNRTLYYVIRYQKNLATGAISEIPVPIVGRNQKLAIQILGQVRKNKGICSCLSEPSTINLTINGPDINFDRNKELSPGRMSQIVQQRSRSVVGDSTDTRSSFDDTRSHSY